MNKLLSVKNKDLYKILLLCTVLLWTALIFLQSMQNAQISSRESGRIVDIIHKISAALGINIESINLLTHYIRKSAHFLEFGMLGILSFLATKAFQVKSFAFAVIPIAYCSVVAATDEFIQKFSEGRSSQVSDALLDTTGASCFILAALAITWFRKKRKNRKL